MATMTFRASVAAVALAAVTAALTGDALADDTLQNLYLATAGPMDTPNAGLIVGSDGNIYGTTQGYNTNNGVVFALSADGSTYTAIYPFTGGQTVYTGVTEGSDGALYGTIYSGQAPIAKGAVFKVTKTGVYSTLHAFVGTDGQNPAGPLLIASDGTIYGTTNGGGASAGNSWGTIFSIDSSGTFSTIYDFSTHDGTVFGKNPRSRLLFATDGTIYGTTTVGGSGNRGTVFALAADNTLDAVALDSTIGQGPHDLVQACDGFIYGRAFGGTGVIFKMDPASGALSVLHALTQSEGNFNYNLGDGNATGGGLIEGLNHSLYGVARYGGSHNQGSVFEVALDGTFTVHVNATNGPWGIMQAPGGNLYGTATNNNGIFEVMLAADQNVAGACPVSSPTGTGGSGGATGKGGATGSGGTTGSGGATGTAGSTGSGGGGTGTGGATGSGGATGTGGDGAQTGGGGATGGSDTAGSGGSKSGGGCSVVGGPTLPDSALPIAIVFGIGAYRARRRRVRS